MLTHDLKHLSLEELLSLLRSAQRNLALSTEKKQGAAVIQKNKEQLQKVTKAIVDKRADPIPIT